jgi:hypothetical protein
MTTIANNPSSSMMHINHNPSWQNLQLMSGAAQGNRKVRDMFV